MRNVRLIALPGLIVVAAGTAVTAQPDPRIPPEVLHKVGYVNPAPKPSGFSSVMLWGIAIADTRVPHSETARIEIAHTQLSCRVDGNDVVLNDDQGKIRGGLYRRYPWFRTDEHEPLPAPGGRESFNNDGQRDAPRPVILRVGTRPDRVWHFWAASPRKTIPPGRLEGCTVKIRARISHGALFQVGFDYWRNPSIGYGSGGNNHEAGASEWYFPSDQWQEAVFSDLKP